MLNRLNILQIDLNKGDYTLIKLNTSKIEGFEIVLMNQGDEFFFHLDNPPPEFTTFPSVKSGNDNNTILSFAKMKMITQKDETNEDHCDPNTDKLTQKGK